MMGSLYAMVAAGFLALAGIAYGLYERADAATAKAIAARYGATAVPMPPYYPAQWRRILFNPASMWYLQMPDGTLINAGILADYFRRNPEAEYPGVADKYVRDYIAAAEAGR